MIGFTEAFTKESDNFMTSGLTDYDKNKIQVQVINESKYIKNIVMQLCNKPVAYKPLIYTYDRVYFVKFCRSLAILKA